MTKLEALVALASARPNDAALDIIALYESLRHHAEFGENATKEPDPNRCTKCDLPFCGCAVPTYPSNTPAELAPLVVEQARNKWWNIHTPDRKHFYGTTWIRYEQDANTDPDALGSYPTKEGAEGRLAKANSTRPDRPAKEPPPPKPAARWRPASERPEDFKTLLMKIRTAPASNERDRAVSGEWLTVGCYEQYAFRAGAHKAAFLVEDVLGWLYASEVLPE